MSAPYPSPFLLPQFIPTNILLDRIDVGIRLRRGITVDNLLIVKRLLKNNPKAIFNPDAAGNTSLHLAAQLGRTEIAGYLVDGALHERDGVSLNTAADTPLMLAAAEGHEGVVRFLLERFPECVDLRNRLGFTALMLAAVGGQDGVVNILLDQGADHDVVDGLGNTALHYASAYGHLKVMRTLVDRGAAVDRPNRQGWKPISYSCTFEAERYFEQLVQDREVRWLQAGASVPESERARARAATPVFGRSEWAPVAGRARASSGS